MGARVCNYWLAIQKVHETPAPASTDVWASGFRYDPDDAGFDYSPLLLHYDGTAWSDVAIPATGRDDGSVSKITAVGHDGVYFTADWHTLHWDGSGLEWLPDPQLVFGAPGQSTWRVVYEAGVARLSELQGDQWVERGVTPFDERVLSWSGGETPWILAGSSNDDLWIAGAGARLFHWHAGALSGSTVEALTTQSLNLARGFGEHVWVAGGGEVLHFDGSSWSKTSLAGEVDDLYVASPQSAWTVGGTSISEHRGALWLLREKTTVPMYAIHGSGPDDVWAVGAAGEVRHFDGSSWARLPPPTPSDLHSVAVLNPDDAWVAGVDGVLMHREGNGWTSRPLPNVGPSPWSWPTLWAAAHDDVWATSSDGVFHWDGAQWGKLTNVYGYHFTGTGPADVWLVGGVGAWHFDGASWAWVPTGLPAWNLYASPTTLWVVGDHGSILRRPR